MSEASQRRTVVRALSGLHAIPVENPVACPGTPDVNYVEGWIELKNLRNWPKRAATIVRIEHFTEQQRRFLRRRCGYGGSAWLLLQCRAEWLLFKGGTAANVVGLVNRADLYMHAYARWERGLVARELLACLKQTKN